MMLPRTRWRYFMMTKDEMAQIFKSRYHRGNERGIKRSAEETVSLSVSQNTASLIFHRYLTS